MTDANIKKSGEARSNSTKQKSQTKNQNDVSQNSAPKNSSSTSEPSSMEELLAQTGYQIKGVKRGDIVEGVVLSVSPRHLLLDIGGKGEGVVHEKEMPYITDIVRGLKIGDKITVQVVNAENDRGQVVVSLRKTALSKRWELLTEKLTNKEEVEVTIRELSKGGFLVDYQGLRGFVPLSQADSELVKTGDRASGRRVKAKVIEVDKDANRLVFSQRSGLSNERQKEIFKSVEVGKVYPAEITGIVQFGAFANVKITADVSLPGLIHISEIAWEKVENPADYFKINQKLDVKIIGADPNTGKLTLSIKQLLSDPWEDVAKVFSVEQVVKGKVSRISPYGVFVSLLPGIDGLVHISKIAPGEEPKVGEDVECNIEEINPDRRKISLSLVAHAKPIGYR
jgi:ribosomal protein S1